MLDLIESVVFLEIDFFVPPFSLPSIALVLHHYLIYEEETFSK